jgi:hypothetical protein
MQRASVLDVTILVGLEVWSRTACESELPRGTREQVDSPRRVMCRSCGNFSRLRGPVATACVIELACRDRQPKAGDRGAGSG